MHRSFYVYIMTNRHNNVLYTGVTNDLRRRVLEHKEKASDGFTSKYQVNKLVYYEVFESIQDAIDREKCIKGGSRKRKRSFVDNANREWMDLTHFVEAEVG